MPFTFAHPAIVLSMKNASRRFFSFTAVIVGSMTPDFEYFIRMRDFGMYGHTLWGLLWFDIPLGLIIFYIYQFLVKDALIDHLPQFLNTRFSALRGVQTYKSPAGRFLVIVFSILLGAASHILWDSFTHRYGFFVLALPALSRAVYIGHGHYLAVYNLMQHFSSILGLIIISIAVMRMPKQTDSRAKHLVGFWLVIFTILIAVVGIKFALGLHLRKYGNVIICAISGGLLGLITASAIFGRNKSISVSP